MMNDRSTVCTVALGAARRIPVVWSLSMPPLTTIDGQFTEGVRTAKVLMTEKLYLKSIEAGSYLSPDTAPTIIGFLTHNAIQHISIVY